MQLFIEQNFINDYYLESGKSNLSEEKMIIDIMFSEFTELEVFLDCETEAEIKEQICQNSILNKIFTNNPSIKPIGRFEDYFKGYNKPKQGLVFLQNKSEWSKTLFNKGFLCFFYDTYEQSIKEIINNLHFRIDLSEITNSIFNDWDEFKRFKALPLNSIIVSDKYILSDKTGQEINRNLIPFLKSILEGKKETNIDIAILTDKVLLNENIPDKGIKEREEVKKRYKYLKSKFAQYSLEFSIVKIHSIDKLSNFELHDRIVYSNYSILEIGKGFNLSKNISNDKLQSNSQIICETIFYKYTYNRLKNHFRLLSDYFKELKDLKHAENPFKYYPDKFYNILLD